ncbi:FecR family protein [Peristeroidobacter soli]|jgi:transmembrane sensor|uniref:FecR family protein n=1 Tax=Peristeroidobacter soli TaxID=2497877 RepID=UPI00101D8BB6|nr:FecR domain-containing protein [Peristeroidobacter soli]
MSKEVAETQPGCTPAEIDEAAVWIARLHAPDRTLQVERGFKRWLAGSPGRARAFEIVSDGWELAGRLQHQPFPRMSRWQRAGFREGFMRASAVVAAMSVLVVVALVFYFRAEGVSTSVGEQRVLTLEDGSRITLNTSTRIVTHYDEHVRKVELRSGEALFEVVKKEASWPFVVVAGDRTITALGTSFVVREDAKGTSVVLMEGRVSVASAEGQRAAPQVLSPGQRVTFANGEASLDEPVVQKVVAWRFGQVDLEDTTLEAAAEEMNRYSTVKLSIATPEARKLRVNGVFRTGDTASFAAALAATYGLTVVSAPDTIVLEGEPRASNGFAK